MTLREESPRRHRGPKDDLTPAKRKKMNARMRRRLAAWWIQQIDQIDDVMRLVRDPQFDLARAFTPDERQDIWASLELAWDALINNRPKFFPASGLGPDRL